MCSKRSVHFLKVLMWYGPRENDVSLLVDNIHFSPYEPYYSTSSVACMHLTNIFQGCVVRESLWRLKTNIKHRYSDSSPKNSLLMAGYAHHHFLSEFTLSSGICSDITELNKFRYHMTYSFQKRTFHVFCKDESFFFLKRIQMIPKIIMFCCSCYRRRISSAYNIHSNKSFAVCGRCAGQLYPRMRFWRTRLNEKISLHNTNDTL